MFYSCPLYILDEEGFEGAVDVGDEIDGVEENGAEADGGLQAELFAFDHFDGDEHEDEVNEGEGRESGEESEAGFTVGAELDEAAEEHDDDADEHQNDRLHTDDFATEAAEVVGWGGVELA